MIRKGNKMSKLALLGGKKIRTKPFPPHPVLGKEERKEVGKVLKTGVLSGFVASGGEFFLGGLQVKKLEEDFKKYFSVKYAVTVNSATAGLHAALAACGVGPADEVIVTPYTMSASSSAILMCNAVPVFTDIEEDIYCLDPAEIEKKITPRTKAILVVHLFGQAADMYKILRMAKKHKLSVIEDTAQSPGAIYKGRYAGTMGTCGVFSLNQHKTITTGEGGVVLTNNSRIADKLRLIRNHGEAVVEGIGEKDIVNTLGWNYRMTELEASVGIAQFKKLNKLTKHRIALAKYLTKRLKECNFKGIELPLVRKGNKHVYFVYPVKFKEKEVGIKRDTFIKAITAEGIPFAGGYVKPLYLAPLYRKELCYGKKGCPIKCPLYKGKVSYKKGICPVTEKMHYKELILTALCRYPLKRSDIEDIVRAFKKVFDNIDELKNYENRKKK